MWDHSLDTVRQEINLTFDRIDGIKKQASNGVFWIRSPLLSGICVYEKLFSPISCQTQFITNIKSFINLAADSTIVLTPSYWLKISPVCLFN